MVAQDTFTTNLRLRKVGVDRKNWAEGVNENYDVLDAVVGSQYSITNFQGAWQNSTNYAAGVTVADTTTGTVFLCAVSHTSASLPTTFAMERTNNPTYWQPFSASAVSRGAWTPNTVYGLNNFVVNGSQYAISLQAHTSSTSFAADVADGKWSIIIDLSAAGSAVLPIPGGLPDANKITGLNSLGTGYTNNSADDVLTILGATTVGKSVLRAVSTAAALAALAAQPLSSVLTSVAATPVTTWALGFLTSSTAAAGRMALNLPASAVTPEDYGAVGDGITDDTVPILNAMQSGFVVNGNFKTYAVNGTVRPLFGFKGLININIKQLNAAQADCRTIFLRDHNNYILANVTVDCGGASGYVQNTSSMPATYQTNMTSLAGIWFEGDNLHVENVKAFNVGPGNGIFINDVTNSYISNIIGEDGFYNFAPNPDPTDDVIQLIRIGSCENTIFNGIRASTAYGMIAGVESPRYTRGVAVVFNNHCIFNNIYSEKADQNFDISGGEGNSFCTISNFVFDNGGSVALKFANSQHDIVVTNGIIKNVGLWAIPITGNSAALQPTVENIHISNVKMYYSGADNWLTGTQIWSAAAEKYAVAVFYGSLGLLDQPRRIVFENCDVIDDPNNPTGWGGYYNEVVALTPTGTDGDKNYLNEIRSCRASGISGAFQSGFHYEICQLTQSGATSIADDGSFHELLWDTETYDSAAMHSTSNTGRIYAKSDGFFELDVSVPFNNNATGVRFLRVTKNGAVQGPQDQKPGHATSLIYGQVSVVLELAIGDTVGVEVRQTSGGALNVGGASGYFSLKKIA